MKYLHSVKKNIQTKIISFRNHREYYITLTELGTGKKFLKDFLHDLEKKKIRIVKIVYLGNHRMLEKYRGITKRYPTLVIANSPASTSLKNASICIHAVEGDCIDFRHIKMNREVVGTYFADENFENISLSGIGAAGRILLGDFKRETQGVYTKIDTILSRFHFPHDSVYRYWNFLKNVSKNYSSFNAVRDQYFTEHRVTHFPAATGIEARLSGSAQIQIGLEAVKPAHKNDVTTEIVTSGLQSEAWSYGPKFSRAILVEFPKDDVKKLYISGTSSVDRKGQSITQNGYEENIRYVLASVAHLLKKNGMGLGSLLTSYVYCKNKEVQQAFERLYAYKKWKFPYNLVVTNICRADLLFEIECTAAKTL